MAKRFTDTEKWKKQWFRELSPKMKCAWEYLRDMCDHAGVWEADFVAMNFLIGEEVTAEEIERAFVKRILKLKEGKKYLLLGFIKFQYVKLKDGNRTHESVKGILKADAPHIDPASLEEYPKPYRAFPSNQANQPLSSSQISDSISEIIENSNGQKDEKTPIGFKRPVFNLGEAAS